MGFYSETSGIPSGFSSSRGKSVLVLTETPDEELERAKPEKLNQMPDVHFKNSCTSFIEHVSATMPLQG